MADVSKRVQKAQKYLLKGKTRDALEEYLLAYKEDPSNDSIVEVVAELYLKQKETDKALQCFGYLFDKNVEQRNGPGAVLVYRKMVRLGIKDLDRLFICAGFLEKDKPQEARDSYRTCIQAFEERGDKQRALDGLARLATLEPTNPDVPAQMGRIAEGMGNTDPAALYFVRAAKLTKGEKVLEWLTHAHDLQPRDHEIGGLLGAALFAADRAQEASVILEPVSPAIFPDRNRLLAQCYLRTARFDRAEELLWSMVDRLADGFDTLLRLAERYINDGALDRALMMVPRLKSEMFGRGKEKLFQDWIEKIRSERKPSVSVLRVVSTAYKEMNMEIRRAATNAEIFELAMEEGDFVQAASALEVLAELEAQNADNTSKLERLQGKIGEDKYRSLSALLHPTAASAAAGGGGMPFREWRDAGAGAADGTAGETDGLDSQLLQAELLLQFSGTDAAADYLRDLLAANPGAEQQNQRFRALLVEAGVIAAEHLSAPPSPAPRAGGTVSADSLADFRRISEITRNIHRQATVKDILSVAVNEIGKGWNASRCLAGLCVPGKPPTAAVEYCAAGIRRSDGPSVMQLITVLSHLTAGGKPLAAPDVTSAPALGPVSRVLQLLGVTSLLALPLMHANQQTGVLVLQQCGQARQWSGAETEVFSSIAEQLVLALSQLKLRSLVNAVADENSGLLARTAYIDCLMRECDKAQKQRSPLCAALVDFTLQSGKRPPAAESDRIIREAAEVLSGQLRQGDIGVRYDGASIAIVFPGTAPGAALSIIDKVRRLTGGIQVNGRETLRVSCGVAEAIVRAGIEPADSVTEWINRLEAALELARRCANNTAELPAPRTAV